MAIESFLNSKLLIKIFNCFGVCCFQFDGQNLKVSRIAFVRNLLLIPVLNLLMSILPASIRIDGTRREVIHAKGQSTFITHVWPIMIKLSLVMAVSCVYIQMRKHKQVLEIINDCINFAKHHESELLCKFRERCFRISIASFASLILFEVSVLLTLLKFNPAGILLLFITRIYDFINITFMTFIHLQLSYFVFLLEVLNSKLSRNLNPSASELQQMYSFYSRICKLIDDFNKACGLLVFSLIGILLLNNILRWFMIAITIRGILQLPLKMKLLNVLLVLPYFKFLMFYLLKPCQDIEFQVSWS